MEQLPALPETAQVIAEVIGREATLKLASKVRNRNLYIPKRADEHHWISRTIGYAKAHALVQEFGGLLMSLATCEHYFTRERNARIRADYSAGKTTLELAAIHDMTQRRIQQIVEDLRK